MSIYDIFVSFTFFAVIAFFFVLIFAVIYTVIKMFREEKKNGRRN